MRATSRTPGPTADAAAGRMSMPFLPTLATVVVLAAASAFCPGREPAAPAKPVAAPVAVPVAVLAPAAPGFAALAHAAPPQPGPRLPAPLAFAALYPLDPAAAPEPVAIAAHAPPSQRAPHRLVAARRPCPGRRCPETPLVPGSRGAEPPARAEAEEAGGLPPSALPFAEAVAETVAPAMRAVEQAAGAMAGRAAGGAADLVRGGAVSVTGSVALLAACLP